MTHLEADELAADAASLSRGFLRSLERFPSRPALEVAGVELTYEELARLAYAIAHPLTARGCGDPPTVAIFAHRSPTAFAGVLGTLLSGRAYVPIQARFPAARNRAILAISGCRSIVVDAEATAKLEEILPSDHSLQLILPDGDADAVEALRERWPMHDILGPHELSSDPVEPSDTNELAYLLFTSGSTGTPKGVPITHRNVTSFVAAARARYGITERDRLSQTFDLTFDLSAFDMFMAWSAGACLCCPSQRTLLNPARFMQQARVSCWFSVPSVGMFMKQIGSLKPGAFPNLRWSLFCGEALPASLAEAWAEAAPNSILENTYGPTEATILCTTYRWDPTRSPAECHHGIVPIGFPLPGTSLRVVDEALHEVAPGEEGELLIGGVQLSPGYWNDPAATERAFVVWNGSRYYRSGDRVRRPARDGEPLTFIGRVDNQLKVLGYRIELGEIESVLRSESGVDSVAALGWPISNGAAEGIVAFVVDQGVDSETLRERLARRLPPYMVPRDVRLLPALPLNSNGKIDRRALQKILEEAHESSLRRVGPNLDPESSPK